MLVVRESGEWQRHHLHAAIEKQTNLTIEEFIVLVIESWIKTKFGYKEYHFEEPANKDREKGWITYCLKKRTKVDLASSIDWVNSTCFECRRA